MERGTYGRTLAIVLAGSFDIFAVNPHRRRSTVVRVLQPGDVVGELGFAVAGPRSKSVVAREPSEIFELERDSLDRLAAAHPALGVRFLSDVLQIIAVRARRAEQS